MTRFATIKRFLNDDSGATAIEYGLIAALISVFAITALGAMGDSLAAVFETSSDAVNGVLPAGE